MATALERIVKQPVAIINKAGAAGRWATRRWRRRSPTAPVLLMALASVSVLPEVDKLFGRPQNYRREQFTGIARINALVIRQEKRDEGCSRR